MNKTLQIAIAIGFVLTSCLTGARAQETLRLGWQIPWATQGQLVMGLKHTNIPELVDVDLEYVGFSYGGPLNRAALAGQVDVLLTADQPALVLLSRSDAFRIVARMMYNRVCLYVPPNSPIKSLQGLAGKRLMGPVGAAAERVAMAALRDAGVKLDELHTGMLDMSQQSALLKSSEGPDEWKGVDALYGFDPLPAIFENDGLARMLHCGKVVSVVVATREMVEERPELLRRFLRGFALAWAYYSQSPTLPNTWFSEESRLNVSESVLDLAASIEPNRWVKDVAEIRLSFSKDDLMVMNAAMQFLIEKGVIKKAFDIEKYIDLRALDDALSDFDLGGEAQRVRPAL